MERRSNRSLFAARAVGVALLAAVSAADASVVKCIGANGSVTYQNSSCPQGAKGEPIDTTPNSGGRFATESEIRETRRLSQDERQPGVRTTVKRKAVQIYNADERRFIQVGMSEAEVRRRIGPPNHTVRRSSTSGKPSSRTKDSTLQWVYLPAADDAQTTMTLTLKGGSVIHIDRKVTR